MGPFGLVISFVAALVVGATLVACDRAGAPATVTVFAAASTTDALRECGRRFAAARGVDVVFSFDSSSNLARQLRAGAPADVFVSADVAWMDDVEKAGLLASGSRSDLLGNELVVVALHAGRGAPDLHVAAEPPFDRIAVADPAHVPAGRYAKAALESLGWWDAWKERMVAAPDVRAALRLVEIGECAGGIVYATDAAASERVSVVHRFPEGSHPPIRYPIARTATANHASADFVAFLRSPEATDIFTRAGFRVLTPAEGSSGP